MVRWSLKSPASPVFTQPFIRAQIKENIKAPRHRLCAGNSPGAMISPHKWPLTRKCFHLMTSSCAYLNRAGQCLAPSVWANTYRLMRHIPVLVMVGFPSFRPRWIWSILIFVRPPNDECHLFCCGSAMLTKREFGKRTERKLTRSLSGPVSTKLAVCSD